MHGKTIPLFLTAIAAFVYVYGIQHTGFIASGEPRYAEISRSMVENNDWVLPRFNGGIHLEKPPLIYWLTAVVFKVCGPHEWSARIVPIVSAFLSGLFLFFLGRRLFGHDQGVSACFILLTFLGWAVFSRFLLTDVLAVFFQIAALWAFWLSRETRKNSYFLIMFGILALGVLTRGLLALLFPALTIVLFLAIEKDLRFFKHPGWLLGTLLFLVVSVPWHVAVELREPGFLKYYYFDNHLGRVLGNYPPGGNESLSLGKFWAISFGGMFPWALFIPATVYGTWKKWVSGELDAKIRFVCIWTLVVFVAISISSARLERYFLPVLPGLALWMSYILHDHQQDKYDRILIQFGFGMIVFASLGLLVVLQYSPEIIPEYSRIMDVVPGISIFFLLGGVFAWFILMHGRKVLAWQALFLSSLCAMFFVNQAIADLDPILSLKGISRFIQRNGTGYEELAVDKSYQYYEGLKFYANREVLILRETNELMETVGRYDRAMHPVITPDVFHARWISEKPILLITRFQKTYLSLKERYPQRTLLLKEKPPFWLIANKG